MNEHRIDAGVHGWLESPSSSAIIGDCLIVSGWVFAGTEIVELSATVLSARHPLQHGLYRDDVARVYAGEPRAALSGFSGYIELGGGPVENAVLEVWATFDDGHTLRLFTRRLTTTVSGGAVSPLRLAATHVVRRPHTLLSLAAWQYALALVARTLGNSIVARTFRSALGKQSPDAPTPPQDAAQAAFARTARASLATFLTSRSELVLNTSSSPAVSVVMVVWNRAELTLKCLQSLAEQAGVAMEIIVVDNASSDETPELLSRVKGLTVLPNRSNLGFTLSANLGARAARGEFLLFLNNDTELAPECVIQLVRTARRADSIGAVGGKLVFPDGRLQEAGSIIWSDGSCDAYGRGGDPAASEYDFERQVDFCSAALLLTRRALFEGIGGFDEGYRPAYYEDADYCAKLWTLGCPVIYQPRAVAIHHEFGSATSQEVSLDLQRKRRPIFVSRQGRFLKSQRSRTDGMLAARSHPHGQPSVIVVDDALPHPLMGSGFPRAAALLSALTELGFLITIYTTSERMPSSESRERFPAVEVIAGSPEALRAFFASRSGADHHHQLVIVSRPHNMRYVKAAMGSNLDALGVPCIYDAEAIYALRDIGRRSLVHQPIPDTAARQSLAGQSLPVQSLIDAEISLTRGCAAVITVSEAERQLFSKDGNLNVSVVGHAVQPDPRPNAFEHRQTILFVGAFGAESPNEDAVIFFCRDILPVLRSGGCHAPLVVAGARIPRHIKEVADPTVSWHSDVGDLTPFYDQARVFVAPTRYSAGIPLKIIEAAARGVPVVCTSRLAQQLGWDPGIELLTAETPQEFAGAVASVHADSALWLRLRDAALIRVAREHSPEVFRSALQHVLNRAVPQLVRTDQRSHAYAAQSVRDAPA